MSGLSARFNERQRVAAALSQMFPDPGTARPRGISSTVTGKRILQLLVLSAGGGEGGHSSALPRSPRPAASPLAQQAQAQTWCAISPANWFWLLPEPSLAPQRGRKSRRRAGSSASRCRLFPFMGRNESNLILVGGNARQAGTLCLGKPYKHAAQPLRLCFLSRALLLRVPTVQPLLLPLPLPSASIAGDVTPTGGHVTHRVLQGDTNAPLCFPQTYVVS